MQIDQSEAERQKHAAKRLKSWDWQVGNFSPSIPVKATYGLIPIKSLSFSPVGLYDLRRYLGAVLPPYEKLNSVNKFIAADIAYMVLGAATNGEYGLTRNKFHKNQSQLHHDSFVQGFGDEARKERSDLAQSTQGLMFDLVSSLVCIYSLRSLYILQAATTDRYFGDATVIIHMRGSNIPGAPVDSRFVKPTVYMPRGLLDELSLGDRAQLAIARMVQIAVEEIGLPNLRRYDAAFRKTFSGQFSSYVPISPTADKLIPTPAARSCVYNFVGRPVGSLDVPSPSPPVNSAPPPVSMGGISSGITAPTSSPEFCDDMPDMPAEVEIDEYTRVVLELSNARDRIKQLERELAAFRPQPGSSAPTPKRNLLIRSDTPTFSMNPVKVSRSSPAKTPKSSPTKAPRFSPATPTPTPKRRKPTQDAGAANTAGNVSNDVIFQGTPIPLSLEKFIADNLPVLGKHAVQIRYIAQRPHIERGELVQALQLGQLLERALFDLLAMLPELGVASP
jgi:hypothetical protein